ncbi:MAG: hypothetical protein PHV68_02775 [Candidatus Gastranaerophilales bacterium]|nr:hypothetical protein [Candidatus Gastranaerophilales bacterium]
MNSYINICENRILNNLIFSDKLLIVIGAIIFPFLAMKLINIPGNFEPMLIFGIFSACFIVGINILKNVFKFPVFAYLIVQLMFIWVFLNQKFLLFSGVNLKLHLVVFGISTLVAIYYIYKNFDYLWNNFTAFRFFFLFFIINIIYFLFYHSDFKLSAIGAGYPVNFSEAFSDADAKFIIFLDSLCPLVALTISLLTFKKINIYEDFSEKFEKIILYFSGITLAYYIICILSKFDFGLSGFGVFIVAFLFLFLGFKLYLNNSNKFHQNNLINNLLLILVVINFILAFVVANKSILIALIFSLGIFILLCKKAGINLKLFNISTNQNKFFRIITLTFCFSLILFLYFLSTDFVGVITDRIQYYVNGFSSLSTLKIRQVNWHYFVVNWIDNLDLFKTLFGFGIGSSRESIFYISAMQSNCQLVQTTHNHYMDMFYEYGLVALLYFSAFFSVLINNLKDIFNTNKDINIKLFSIVSLSILIFYYIYHLADGVRVINALVIFCLIGLIEAIKFNIKRKTDC